MEKILSSLIKASNHLTDTMLDTLIEYVKTHNGYIKTDKSVNNGDKDSIFAFVFDESSQLYRDAYILAVEYDKEWDTINVLISDELKTIEECDQDCEGIEGWYAIKGGLISHPSTIYNICECIYEYT